MNLFRRFLIVAVGAALLGAGSVSCAQGLRPHEPLDPAKAQSLPLTPLEIQTQDGTRHKFSVEVADLPQTRAIGLMHRVVLPPDRGMLFDFGESTRVTMWMRNTFIPLDMLF
ncbi:MAG: DUF192 domain-containing protein, partial [Rhodobacteraceae bacterium]|nr:DUF192 domain-containing protein [Paracoccaceae bacterium]